MVSFFRTDYQTEFDISIEHLKKQCLTTPNIILELRINRDEQRYIPIVHSFFLLFLKIRSPSMCYTDKEHSCIFKIELTSREVLEVLEILKKDICPHAEVLSIKEFIIRNQNKYTHSSVTTKSSNTFLVPLIQFPLIK